MLGAAVAATAAAVPATLHQPAATCSFDSKPTERDLGGGVRAWAYSEPYDAALFRDGNWEGGERYDRYTAWLNETIPRDFGGLDPFDQRACLIHQRDIFASVGFSTHDWDVILNGSVGALYQMNCVESLLWGVQNRYHPQKDNATEFGAYILLDSPANTTVKVYLQTGPTLSVPGMSWVDDLLAADLEAGFSVLTFLHLHPFDARYVRVFFIIWKWMICRRQARDKRARNTQTTTGCFTQQHQVPRLRWDVHPIGPRSRRVQDRP